MQDASEAQTRKLAAIMFTDIKGFSAKMAKNEAAAFELLKTHDAILRVLTARFNGKVVKSIGDSFMVDFSSAVNAVKCAIEAQKRFWAFNRGKSDFDKIEIRAGIHVGEVLIHGDDIYGDCVNVASRIESLTLPTRICISSDTYGQIRNKMELSVFSLGPQELKNIPEPVEIFEVLIPTIPELSQPSARTVDAAQKKKAAEVSIREPDEAQEAQQIEQMKKRALTEQLKEEETRKKKLSEHYTQAEQLFESGQIHEAEQILNEITKLDPQYQEIIERQKKESELEQQVQSHVDNATSLLKAGRLDDAEKEVNEIFRVLPLHSGAQKILSQIEEERYRRQEEQRIKRVEVEQKPKSDQEHKVDQLLEQTRQYLQLEQFKEATASVHEVLLIDPNNLTAHRLIENIQQAEQTKAELLRIQAAQEEEKKHIEKLAAFQRRLSEQKARRMAIRSQQIRKRRSKQVVTISIAGVIIILFALSVPRILEWIYPTTASIAVLRFTSSDSNSIYNDFIEVLPSFISQDLARYKHLGVISPTSSLIYEPNPADYTKIASSLTVDYLLTGVVQERRDRFLVVIRLIHPVQRKIIYQGTLEGKPSSFYDLRKSIVEKVVSQIGISTTLPSISPATKNDAVLQKYISGVADLQRQTGDSQNYAEQKLREALELDPMFAPAKEALARLEIIKYQSTKEITFLENARGYAESALKGQPQLAEAAAIIGEYNFHIQNFQRAATFFENGLQLQPQNPVVFRYLAQLSLIAGNMEQAQKYSDAARRLDPKNPESFRIYGLVRQAIKDYPAALNAYDEVLRLGDQDSLITTNCLMNVWMSNGQYERVSQYCEQVIKDFPGEYRYHYWCGRAYQVAMNIPMAEKWLKECVELIHRHLETNPKDAIAMVYQGLCITRLGKFSEGEAVARRAFEIDSVSEDMYYRLSNIFSIQGKKKEALETLKIALDRQYRLLEIWNPDLSKFSTESEFQSITKKEIEIPPCITYEN
jgi:class 3 adenylate cyclase/TolB-like protein/predicted Zn-dependent protease